MVILGKKSLPSGPGIREWSFWSKNPPPGPACRIQPIPSERTALVPGPPFGGRTNLYRVSFYYVPKRLYGIEWAGLGTLWLPKLQVQVSYLATGQHLDDNKSIILTRVEIDVKNVTKGREGGQACILIKIN